MFDPEFVRGAFDLEVARTAPVHHVVRTRFESGDTEERGFWECSCGRSGSGAAWKIDELSDKHIDHDRGDRRTDRHGGEF